MLAICRSIYTTTTTHRLCRSGSAAGIVFGTFYPSVVCCYRILIPFCVTDAAIITSTVYYSSTTLLLLLLQAAAAVSVISTASRESIISSTLITYPEYIRAIHKKNDNKKLVVGPKAAAAAAAAARPPQPIEHHAHWYLAVQKAALPALVIHNKISRNTSNRFKIY